MWLNYAKAINFNPFGYRKVLMFFNEILHMFFLYQNARFETILVLKINKENKKNMKKTFLVFLFYNNLSVMLEILRVDELMFEIVITEKAAENRNIVRYSILTLQSRKGISSKSHFPENLGEGFL